MHNIIFNRVCHQPFALVVVIAIISLLSACATQTNTPSSFIAIKDKNTIPSSWAITAKLGISSPDTSGSITLQWQQKTERYHIQTSAALGQGRASLTGDNKNLLIERPGKPPVYSKNPQALLLETLGWSLPLQELHYWLQGKPAPAIKIQAKETSPTGDITFLKQANWDLQYSRYKPVNGWVLPHKIIASRDTSTLTLLIRQWQFN